jgi:hypothetical protein
VNAIAKVTVMSKPRWTVRFSKLGARVYVHVRALDRTEAAALAYDKLYDLGCDVFSWAMTATLDRT